jgi:hypothetical protein
MRRKRLSGKTGRRSFFSGYRWNFSALLFEFLNDFRLNSLFIFERRKQRHYFFKNKF